MIWLIIRWWVAGHFCISLVRFSSPVYIAALHLKKSLPKKHHQKSQVLHRRHSLGRLASGPLGYWDRTRHTIRWGELTRVPAGSEERECNFLSNWAVTKTPIICGIYRGLQLFIGSLWANQFKEMSRITMDLFFASMSQWSKTWLSIILDRV